MFISACCIASEDMSVSNLKNNDEYYFNFPKIKDVNSYSLLS